MNNATFFAAIRTMFGGRLTDRHVVGIEALLAAGNGLPRAHMANVLAQVKRETGGGMYPVKETVFLTSRDQNPSDATVIARLDNAWQRGQLPWVKSPYWRGGFFGRGQLQITHKDNYAWAAKVTGVDLVTHPERMLDPDISAVAAVRGMAEGAFTGRKLRDFDRPEGFDHSAARAIVNGDRGKKDAGSRLTIGEEIARDGAAFDAALKAAGWGERFEPPRTAEALTPVQLRTDQNPIKTAEPGWLWTIINALRGAK